MSRKVIAFMILLFVLLAFGQDNYVGGGVRMSPRLLNYQGYITDTLSNPLNGSNDILFRIYDDSISGNLLWSENQLGVPVSKGIFHVLLGSVTPLPDSIFTKGTNRWLSLRISSQDLSPRTRIVSSPYSVTATLSDTALYAKNSAPDNDWTYRVTEGGDTTLQTGGRWGLVRSGNYLFGNNDSTHVNIGVACTTGINLQAFKYSAVLGGYHNKAGRTAAVVAGGQNNSAIDYFTAVGGGLNNTANSSFAVVAGGSDNAASNNFSTVGGGYADTASGDKATVAGGDRNKASGQWSMVGGGVCNTASGIQSTVSGGGYNGASSLMATVSGGAYNYARGTGSFLGGGNDNDARGDYSTVGGGNLVEAYAAFGGALSGRANHAGDSLVDTAAVVAGGSGNSVAAAYGSIGGGAGNYVQSYAARVGGGWNNSANDSFAYVGAGQDNNAAGKYSAILGGYGNTIYVTGDYSYLFGVNSDLFADSTFMVDMPHVWFGTEANGYEFPHNRGSYGQVMVTNGIGQLSWAAAPPDNDWTYRVTDAGDTTLQSGGRWGIARLGSTLYGNADSTHVNLGVACTTGVSGQNYKYCVVGGGRYNRATNVLATVGGGDGNHASGGVATIAGGSNGTASGSYATVAGGSVNTAAGDLATVAGGVYNRALGYGSAIGGGEDNDALGYTALIGGGSYNYANDSFTAIVGGRGNLVDGKYSAILGGYMDTIFATGDYSYLFGINSNLTQDSTFMVDMPHVWFGTEAAGYQFPVSRGTNGQVMITNGSGILSWGGITYVDSSRISAGSHKLQGKDTTALDARWVNEGQAAGGDLTGTYPSPSIATGAVNSDKIQDGSITSADIRDTTITAAKIKDGAVTMAKISQSGATTGQVIKWNGSAWQPAADSFRDNDWTFSVSSGSDTVLQMGGRWGLARPGNTFIGSYDSTFVNLGTACTIGNTTAVSQKYISITGGYNNRGYGGYSFIGGGLDNYAGEYATVSGGSADTASGSFATVGGGVINVADGSASVIAGGEFNTANGASSTIGGGGHNQTDSLEATISGGSHNTARGSSSTVGGGGYNTAGRMATTVAGGSGNNASGPYATVGGGVSNTASNEYATVAGGYGDTASGYYSVVTGGQHNVATDYWATIGGGNLNYVGQRYSTVPGGRMDTVTDYQSFATNYHTKVANMNSAAFTTSHTTADNQVRAAAFSTGTVDIAMDHPDDPMNKILNQYGVASDEVMLIYSGSIVLDASGRAKAVLPDYFDDIARNPRIQLTGVGSADVVYVAEDMLGNSFVVGGKPGMKVYWTVNAERKDIHAEIARIQTPVVQEKTGDLRNHSLDDDAMIGIYDDIRQKNPELFRFMTNEGRQVHEQSKTP